MRHMKEFFEEIWDELTDFIEDFDELLTRRPNTHRKTEFKTTVVNGVAVRVRPAYIFAERIDHTLKLLIGLSILISTFTVSFYGFASLSDLIKVLIHTLWGRGIMFILGMSYVITATWKLLHLTDGQGKA